MEKQEKEEINFLNKWFSDKQMYICKKINLDILLKPTEKLTHRIRKNANIN